MTIRSWSNVASCILVLALHPACGDDRVEVTPGSGSVVATGAGAGGDGTGGTGQGGTGGTGGGGAADGVGAGGAGGAGPSTGGAGGGEPSWDTCETPAACLGDEPSICPENACESEEIFFTCEGSEDSVPAYVACLVWSDLLRENVWGRLVDCLRDAPAEDHCSDGDAVVAACLAGAAPDACPNAEAETTCAQAAVGCADDDPFPIATCEADLQLFGPQGLARYETCLAASADAPCAGRHAACLDEVASL